MFPSWSSIKSVGKESCGVTFLVTTVDSDDHRQENTISLFSPPSLLFRSSAWTRRLASLDGSCFSHALQRVLRRWPNTQSQRPLFLASSAGSPTFHWPLWYEDAEGFSLWTSSLPIFTPLTLSMRWAVRKVSSYILCIIEAFMASFRPRILLARTLHWNLGSLCPTLYLTSPCECLMYK